MAYHLGAMPGFADQLSVLRQGDAANVANQYKMANLLQQMQPRQQMQQQMPEEEGIMSKLGSGFGQGLSSGLTGLVNDYLERQADQRAFGRQGKLLEMMSNNPNASTTDWINAAQTSGAKRADLESAYGIHQSDLNRQAMAQKAMMDEEYKRAQTEDLRSKIRERENALIKKQNDAELFANVQKTKPNATVSDYLEAGVSPETIKEMSLASERLNPNTIKEREVSAQEGRLKLAKQKQVNQELKDLEIPKGDEDSVKEKARQVLEETGDPMKAITAARQEARTIKLQRQKIKDVAKEFDPPNALQDVGGLRGKREEMKQKLAATLPKLGIDNKDMIYDELRKVGWKFDEINEIMGNQQASPTTQEVAPVPQPTTAKRPIDQQTAMKFLQQAGNDKNLARQLAAQEGYEF